MMNDAAEESGKQPAEGGLHHNTAVPWGDFICHGQISSAKRISFRSGATYGC